MSSKFGRIRPRTTELAALELMKKISHILIMGKTMPLHFSHIFDWILFIFAGNEDMHKSLNEFEIRPDRTTGLVDISSLYERGKRSWRPFYGT